jgi:murein DD-endopeptidase MepM/ murein hydrolase activator NlpD
VLRGRIDFLDGFISRETLKLDSLVAFEDRMRLTYGMNPISTDVRKAGIGGVPSPAEKEEGTITDVLTKRSAAMLEGLSMLLRRAQLQHTTFGEMSAYVGQRYRYWSQSPSIWPASGTVTSGFGYRTDPMNGETMFHDGLDIANRTGTPVFAPADGVIKTRGVFQDFGNAVIIAHPESGIETIYGHLDKAFVEEQQFVKRGELVGYVGSSGKSTGPHLHYEIRKSGCAVNPGPYILPADQITD